MHKTYISKLHDDVRNSYRIVQSVKIIDLLTCQISLTLWPEAKSETETTMYIGDEDLEPFSIVMIPEASC